MALYSDKVMDHFMNPRNVGKLDNPSGVGQVGNARCGDIMKIYIQVEDGVITDVKFNTFGCASAIASSSMATELIKGKPIDQALALTNQAVAEALDGLPAIKMHCSVLAEVPICRCIDSHGRCPAYLSVWPVYRSNDKAERYFVIYRDILSVAFVMSMADGRAVCTVCILYQ